jgi:hypothetical protein
MRAVGTWFQFEGEMPAKDPKRQANSLWSAAEVAGEVGAGGGGGGGALFAMEWRRRRRGARRSAEAPPYTLHPTP